LLRWSISRLGCVRAGEPKWEKETTEVVNVIREERCDLQVLQLKFPPTLSVSAKFGSDQFKGFVRFGVEKGHLLYTMSTPLCNTVQIEHNRVYTYNFFLIVTDRRKC
jgi:hypothetical protein